MIGQQYLESLAATDNELFLGIITYDQRVLLQAADEKLYPGHLEWLRREGLANVSRGFSLIVKGGKVTALFPASRLNPAADARLEEHFVHQLIRLLPIDEAFTVLLY